MEIRQPLVSIITPARNAASTLAETIECLRAQTNPAWEALVIDDDSTDDTRAIAESYAARDERIRVLASTAHSEGGARNVGIDAASARWLLFLDADDLIEARTIQSVSRTFAEHPFVDGVVYGWKRFDDSGAEGAFGHWDDRIDPFRLVASHTPFPIHACVIKKAIVVDNGSFDPTVRGVADWDLWQRVFRAGASLVRIHDTLAWYRSHAGAMSRDARAMFEATRVVLDRAYTVDRRVRFPLPVYANGWHAAERPIALLRHLCWWAGHALVAGGDPIELLETVAGDLASAVPIPVPPDLVAEAVAASMRLQSLAPPTKWPTFWREYGGDIRAFLSRLEQLSAMPDLAWHTELLLQPPDAPDASRRRGETLAVDVELTADIEPIDAPAGVSRILVVGRLDGVALGLFEQPLVDGRVDPGTLRHAVADRWFWDIGRRHLEQQQLVRSESDGDEVWAAFVREVWGANAADVRPPIRVAHRSPVVVAAGEPVPRIFSTRGRVDVVVRIGSSALPAVAVAAADARSPALLTHTLTLAHDAELFRAVAHEVLVGRRTLTEPLHVALRRAAVDRAEES